MMKSKTRFLAAGALIIFVFAAIFAGWLWRTWEIQRAKNLVWSARHFMRPDFWPTPNIYEEYDVPRALIDEDDIAVYFLLKSIDVGHAEYSGAYYVLGQHFLDKDCSVSEYYFSLHYEAVNDEDIFAILNSIRNEGCEAAKDRYFSINKSAEP